MASGLLNFLEDGLEFITELPGEIVQGGRDIQQAGFDLNRRLIGIAERARNSESAANLAATEAERRILKIKMWLTNPVNIILVVVSLAAIFAFFWRKK